MTLQEIFDQVQVHLLTQNRKSAARNSHGEDCRYRSGKLSCAVGCLIPDNLYHSGLEGETVFADSVQEVLFQVGVQKDHIHPLFELQKIHDEYDPCEWEYFLQNFAKRQNLQYKEFSNT